MKGRKALPANLHILHGTHRGDRHDGGVQVESINPDPPEELPEEARDEWLRIAPILSKHNLLSSLDLTALEMYCRVYARWLKAERKLEAEDALVFKTQTGYQAHSAYLNVANMCIKQMQSIMGEFGMTPATRARMKEIAKQPQQQGLFDDFLKRKGANG